MSTEMATLSEVDRDSDIMNSKLSQAGAIGESLERLTNEMINRAEADMVDLIHSGQQAYQVSRSTFIGVALVGVAIAVILGYAISAAIIRPVRRMDDQLNQTASGDFSYRVDIPNRDEMGTLATNLNGMNEKLGHLYQALESRNQYIRETFGRYLTDEVVDDILETPDGLRRGGENKQVSIMITDLRGFTALTERLGAEEVVSLLNIYLESMIDIIQQHRGTVNEIFGDSLVVLFGAPQEIPDRISSAVACAIAMQNAMPEVNR